VLVLFLKTPLFRFIENVEESLGELEVPIPLPDPEKDDFFILRALNLGEPRKGVLESVFRLAIGLWTPASESMDAVVKFKLSVLRFCC